MNSPGGVGTTNVNAQMQALSGLAAGAHNAYLTRTRATYGLDADPGRMLGLLLRGPVEATVRDFLLGGAAEGLKQRAESG